MYSLVFNRMRTIPRGLPLTFLKTSENISGSACWISSLTLHDLCSIRQSSYLPSYSEIWFISNWKIRVFNIWSREVIAAKLWICSKWNETRRWPFKGLFTLLSHVNLLLVLLCIVPTRLRVDANGSASIGFSSFRNQVVSQCNKICNLYYLLLLNCVSENTWIPSWTLIYSWSHVTFISPA